MSNSISGTYKNKKYTMEINKESVERVYVENAGGDMCLLSHVSGDRKHVVEQIKKSLDKVEKAQAHREKYKNHEIIVWTEERGFGAGKVEHGQIKTPKGQTFRRIRAVSGKSAQEGLAMLRSMIDSGRVSR